MPADLFAVVDSGAASAVPLFTCEMAGPPRGKGRPRSRIVFPRSGKAFVHVYADPETAKLEKVLAWIAKAAMKGHPPFKDALAMRVFAMCPIPVSWPKKSRDAALVGLKFPTTTPDGDNILKLVKDALNEIVYVDDKQVVRALVWKEYAENPGLIIELYALP